MVDKCDEHNPNRDDGNPCDGCVKCCEYVAIELDEPEDKDDFDNIRWYLLHEDVWVFVDHDDSWNVQFNTCCEKLGEDGWCGYYEKRPGICRIHKSENCEKYGGGDSYKLLFKTLGEFEEWFVNGQVIPEDEDEPDEEELDDEEVEEVEEETWEEVYEE